VVPLPGGGVIDLAKYRGKTVVLEFISTGCEHCQKSSVMLQRLMKEYGPRGFQPLAVAINEGSMGLVPAFLKTYGITYPVAATDLQPYYAFLKLPVTQMPLVPQIVFIDRQGVIKMEHVGELEEPKMRAQIESMLASGPAPPKPAQK
jgi:thiol-disulfide isomerase/thioredoxin